MKTVITNKPLTQTWVTVNEGKVTGEYGSRDKARAAKTGTVAKAQELNVVVQTPEATNKRAYHKSTVKNPSQVARDVFLSTAYDEDGNRVPGVKLKDVVKKCEDMGIANGTARLGRYLATVALLNKA